MFSTAIISFLNENVLSFAIGVLLPAMTLAFVFGVIFRVLIYYTIKRHDWFAREFEKLVNKFIESEDPSMPGDYSFYVIEDTTDNPTTINPEYDTLSGPFNSTLTAGTRQYLFITGDPETPTLIFNSTPSLPVR